MTLLSGRLDLSNTSNLRKLAPYLLLISDDDNHTIARTSPSQGIYPDWTEKETTMITLPITRILQSLTFKCMDSRAVIGDRVIGETTVKMCELINCKAEEFKMWLPIMYND